LALIFDCNQGTAVIMVSCKVLCFSLLLAGGIASPVVPQIGNDLHFDIPNVSHEVVEGLTVSLSDGTVDVKNFTINLVKPGVAEATADLIDVEIPKYSIDGWKSAFHIHGSGLISLKVPQLSVNVTYTPSPEDTDCALKNSTKYSVSISKIEFKITGLKLDLSDIDSVAEKYIEDHASTIAATLETNMNGPSLHKYVDPWTVQKINAVCTKAVVVEKILQDVLEAAVKGALHIHSN